MAHCGGEPPHGDTNQSSILIDCPLVLIEKVYGKQNSQDVTLLLAFWDQRRTLRLNLPALLQDYVTLRQDSTRQTTPPNDSRSRPEVTHLSPASSAPAANLLQIDAVADRLCCSTAGRILDQQRLEDGARDCAAVHHHLCSLGQVVACIVRVEDVRDTWGDNDTRRCCLRPQCR